MNLTAFDQAGSRGQGVRVAIIDLGFRGWESLLGTELPSTTTRRSFVNAGNSASPTAHGTACAELVHDIAPEAQLYLLEIAETIDFTEAVSWCIDNDIHVVNMSLAFFAGPRDGTGTQSDEVNRAADAGIIFVISSGNEGASHWQGTWTDVDGDSTLDVGPGNNVIGFDYRGQPSGFPVLIVQTIWDQWPSTAGLSFDLEVYRDSARTQMIANSSGSPSLSLAHRLLALDNLPVRRYYLSIKHRFGRIPTNLRFDVYIEGDKISGMSPRDSLGSLTSPADATGAVAVGAYTFTVNTPGATPIHNYSSQGPTWDGRIKPELVAGSGVSTVSFGSGAFFGTSASAPHVAGAAAVLSSAAVSGALFTYVWSPVDFVRLLQVNSVDFGAPGMDKQSLLLHRHPIPLMPESRYDLPCSPVSHTACVYLMFWDDWFGGQKAFIPRPERRGSSGTVGDRMVANFPQGFTFTA
jgi:subtilisin family serine protease